MYLITAPNFSNIPPANPNITYWEVTHGRSSLPVFCWHHQSVRSPTQKPDQQPHKGAETGCSWSTYSVLYMKTTYIHCKRRFTSYRETSVIREECCHLPRGSVESGSMTTCTWTQLSARCPSLLCPAHQPQTLQLKPMRSPHKHDLISVSLKMPPPVNTMQGN